MYPNVVLIRLEANGGEELSTKQFVEEIVNQKE